MLLELIAATSSVVGGFVFGRIYAGVSGDDLQLVKYASGKKTDSDEIPELPSADKVNGVAEKLKEHAESMAASVDEHQSKMQAFNDSLTENNNASAEDVLVVVNELIEANRTMQRELNKAQMQIHEQSMELESAERCAHTDALTRIPNRGAFDMFMAQQHEKGGKEVSIFALLDVDHFKKFNDNYGHLAGDEVLRVVSGLLHSRLNQYGMVARYGGEEFAMIFTGTTENEVKQLVEKTRIAISQRDTEFENKSLRVTASIGIAQFDGKESIEEWIQRADAGLYRSKEIGRNCTHWMDRNEPILVNAPALANGPAPTEEPALVDEPEQTNKTDSEPSQVSDTAELRVEVELETTIDQAQIPDAFADISNQAELNEAFAGIRSQMQSDFPIFVMAIRNHEGNNESVMKSLLPVVRSTLRSIDRIGYANASTLLICMLSVDKDTVKDRGAQICHSALAMDMASGKGSKKPVTVGIGQASSDEDFDSVVSRAIELANQGLQEGSEPVCMESTPAITP